jgi:hypothetical protein
MKNKRIDSIIKDMKYFPSGSSYIEFNRFTETEKDVKQFLKEVSKYESKKEQENKEHINYERH